MRQRLALTGFLLTPLLVLGVILLIIKYSRPAMNAPPIGAGAGSTGGANAIGEYLAHGNAKPRNPQAPAVQPEGMVAPESLAQGFVLVVTDQSKLAGTDSPIYFAGNINNWNPADPAYKLSQQSDGRWRITITKPEDGRTIEFKFTRGTWDLEELDANLNVINNRTLPKIDASKLAPGVQPKIELDVPHWGDQRAGHVKKTSDAYRHIEAVGTLRRVQVAGGAGTVPGQMRDLLVWLPPGYDEPQNASARYPVLYLHDGQNLFEKPDTAPAEWRVDETATELIGKGQVQPLIIVGIPHSGEGRISEYLPCPALGGITPQGSRHIRWLLDEVLPRVERCFRVKTGPENTGIGGSSLGAAVALEAVNEHPEVFGLLLAESLPLRTGKAEAWDQWTAGIQNWPQRVFLGIGGNETGPEPAKAKINQAYRDAVQALSGRMESAGLGSDHRMLLVDVNAVHNEDAWAKRFPQALTFLFGTPAAP